MENEFIARKGIWSLGGFTTPYVERYSAQGTYNISYDDYLINCTSGSFTVILPTAVGVQGKHYVIKNSSTGVITVNTTNSQKIDGLTSISLMPGDNLYIYSTGLDNTGNSWVRSGASSASV